jgi:hypothetical protein
VYFIRSNLRRRFWNENNVSSQQQQIQHVSQSSRNSRQIADEEPRQYRQQYINAKPISPTNELSYINSFFPDSTPSFDTSSVATMRTFLESSCSSDVLPGVETPIPIVSPIQPLHSMYHGSILVHTYFQQGPQPDYLV